MRGFKAGDKVKYVGYKKQLLGCSGVVIRRCRMLSGACVVVKMPNGYEEEHISIKYLELNQKNQQLLFNFMQD